MLLIIVQTNKISNLATIQYGRQIQYRAILETESET